MDGVLDGVMGRFLSGYDCILWLESVRTPWLDWVAVTSSFLGSEAFFLLFVPFYYWCCNKRHGVRLALVFLLSACLNSALKDLFQTPRPDSGRVTVLYRSSGNGYSFPSGHAQNAVVFWGWLGRRQPWRSRPYLLGAAVLLISLSRVYLGLHFPIDILGGWIFGACLLAGMVWVDHRISARPKVWAGRILPWAGLVLPVIIYLLRSSPFQAMTSGAMLGFCMGYLVESRWLAFSTEAPWMHQAGKCVGGWSAGALLSLSLQSALPAGDEFLFLRYALLGTWVSLGLPASYVWITQKRERGIAVN